MKKRKFAVVPVICKFTVKEGRMQEAIETMKVHEANVAKEEGTIMYKYFRHKKYPNVVMLIELYKDQEAFETHCATPYLKEFIRVSTDWVTGKTEVNYLEEF